MSYKLLIEELKENGQDFEHYPTTNEIIASFHKDLIQTIGREFSILDCGAGTGKVLSQLQVHGEQQQESMSHGKATTPESCYAIEKSSILLSKLPKDIFVVGADFWDNTLLDKKVDVVFSNPPFSEYAEWSSRIIKEANARFVYLVIPQRWKENKKDKVLLETAIELRNGVFEVVGSFDFSESEDRKARAKADLVKITLTYEHGGYHTATAKVDPFDLWFDEAYKNTKEEVEIQDHESEKTSRKNELIAANGLVEALVHLYDKEMMDLLENYRKIQEFDEDILSEMGVSVSGLKASLKLKIKNLKSCYWKELFSNLDKITKRLTYQSRNIMLDKLFSSTQVDFKETNIHSVLEWCIKNANSYYDKQLSDVFIKMLERANVIKYKSNERVFRNNDWYYQFENNPMTHVKLDLRVVLERVGGLYTGDMARSDGAENGLKSSANIFINDLLTIANNLGFTNDANTSDYVWNSSSKKSFPFRSLKTGKEEQLMTVNAYKNGNLHIKFNQSFIFSLNVEMARINGWIQNTAEASEEMDIPKDIVESVFNSNFIITPSVTKNLLPNFVKSA